MADAPRRLFDTLRALALALVNATLILLALCLWLGWMVLSDARAVSAGIAANLSLLAPLQTELSGLRADVAGLRSDLAARRDQTDSTAALAERAGALDTRLSGTAEKVDALLDDPALLIDRAVDRAVLQIRSGIAACAPPGT